MAGMAEVPDDFDYSMQFASPAVASRWNCEPTVFLFGWAGCRDRYLARYAEMYAKLGCTTIRYTAPTSVIFRRSRAHLLAIGAKVNDLFHELEMGQQPYFVHMFSGGGCVVYDAWLEAIALTKEQKASTKDGDALTKEGDDVLKEGDVLEPPTRNLKGLIFDCCPADTSKYQRSIAYCDVFFPTLRNRFLQFAVRLVFTTAFFVMDLVKYFIGGFGKLIGQDLGGPRRGYYNSFVADTSQLTRPNLFLYSQADEICSAASIERFMDKQREKGVEIFSKKWDALPHCQLYRYDPEGYQGKVGEFLDKVAGSYLADAAE